MLILRFSNFNNNFKWQSLILTMKTQSLSSISLVVWVRQKTIILHTLTNHLTLKIPQSMIKNRNPHHLIRGRSQQMNPAQKVAAKIINLLLLLKTTSWCKQQLQLRQQPPLQSYHQRSWTTLSTSIKYKTITNQTLMLSLMTWKLDYTIIITVIQMWPLRLIILIKCHLVSSHLLLI